MGMSDVMLFSGGEGGGPEQSRGNKRMELSLKALGSVWVSSGLPVMSLMVLVRFRRVTSTLTAEDCTAWGTAVREIKHPSQRPPPGDNLGWQGPRGMMADKCCTKSTWKGNGVPNA